MAATVFSSTPVKAPFQPACAAPITPRFRVGKQHRTAIGRRGADARCPGVPVTIASALGRSPWNGSLTTITSGEWI